MGGCWPETYKDYPNTELYGHFLSIIEATDPHGTCNMISIDGTMRKVTRRSHSIPALAMVLFTKVITNGFSR